MKKRISFLIIHVKYFVFSSIDNQCWILPAVYRGYITKIFWFKSPWAHQFQDGIYQLHVGKCQQTGVLKYEYFSTMIIQDRNSYEKSQNGEKKKKYLLFSLREIYSKVNVILLF